MVAMTDLNHRKMVSLGRHCQPAYQLRRFTGQQTAFPFDWAISPFAVVTRLLRTDFCGAFLYPGLQIIEDGQVVLDKSTGMAYRHAFSRDQDTGRITRAILEREYASQYEKHLFLLERWRSVVRTEPTVFVRQEHLDAPQALELLATLRDYTGDRDTHLLLVTPGQGLTRDSPARPSNLFIAAGVPLPSSPSDWKGHDDVWDRLLHDYRVSAAEASAKREAEQPKEQAASVGGPHRSTLPTESRLILFIPLPELGHILPTLRLARWLTAIGYRVTYLTDVSFASTISSAGAEVLDLEETCSSSRAQMMRFAGRGTTRNARLLQAGQQGAAFTLIDKRMCPEGIPTEFGPGRRCFYSTSLPNWDEPQEPENDPTLILCPAALEIPKFRQWLSGVYYVEPSLHSLAEGAVIESDTMRPLIFVSFGTQCVRDLRLDTQLGMIVELAKRMPNLRFIVSAGPAAAEHAGSSSHNLSLHAHVPQRMLLQKASAIITHGGLGTLKEAVMDAVPMLVLPALYDQPFNAMRVRHHGLGEAFFPEHQCVSNLQPALQRLLTGQYASGLQVMRKAFSEAEDTSPSRELLLRWIST